MTHSLKYFCVRNDVIFDWFQSSMNMTQFVSIINMIHFASIMNFLLFNMHILLYLCKRWTVLEKNVIKLLRFYFLIFNFKRKSRLCLCIFSKRILNQQSNTLNLNEMHLLPTWINLHVKFKNSLRHFKSPLQYF